MAFPLRAELVKNTAGFYREHGLQDIPAHPGGRTLPPDFAAHLALRGQQIREKGMQRKRRGQTVKIRRFRTIRLVEHFVAMLTVLILVMTGLSQKFYSLDFSQWFILLCGGIDNVRILHRYTGAIFALATMVHVLIAIFGMVIRRWQPTMMITKNDLSDAIHSIRYYIGLENHPARCDRYDFKQKFEYWGILVGGFLMIVSGVILWFPMKVTHFVPGELIPVSKALHTNEAMLIFIMIAVWHVYNAIFSPEVFPMDTSIITGKISRERMVREHPIELARIEGVSLEEILKSPHKNSSQRKQKVPSRKAAY
jgi:formate dehydrogenase gamma subunit